MLSYITRKRNILSHKDLKVENISEFTIFNFLVFLFFKSIKRKIFMEMMAGLDIALKYCKGTFQNTLLFSDNSYDV